MKKKHSWPDVEWLTWDNWCYQIGVTVNVIFALYILAKIFS